MKKNISKFLLGIISLVCIQAKSQNVSINLLTQNNGIVNVGSTVYLELTFSNTSNTSTVGNYRLKPLITLPTSVTVRATGPHVFPSGWGFLNGLSGQVGALPNNLVRLTNGTGTIGPNSAVTVLLAVEGLTISPSTPVQGTLAFSNGSAPGTGNGTLSGNNTNDDNATAVIEVQENLPLKLTSFRGTINNCLPKLTWTTEQEVDTKNFIVERTSANLVNTNWTEVGIINAAGTSSTPKNYSFADNSYDGSLGKQLYRLKMVDLNGTYEYSGIVTINNTSCQKPELILYQNPMKGKITFMISGFERLSNATIYSAEGQLVLTKQISNGTTSIDIDSLSSGVYFLNITDIKGNKKQSKFVVQK